MIPGRFGDTSRRPYIGGRLILPRLNLSANLSFLVDTGADRSTLMPADAHKTGVNYTQLSNPTTAGGIGGIARCFRESAVLFFDEPNRNLARAYAIFLIIPEPNVQLRNMPSLLGRDVLDRWYMHYDPSRDRLSFTVRSADHTQKV